LASIRRSLLLSFIERYSVLAITLVSTMVLARLLTPGETGLYSVGAALINIAQTFRDFGVATYVLQEEDLTRRRLATALGVALALAAVTAGGFVAAAPLIAGAFHEPRLQTVVLVMSVNFIGVAFASIGGARLRRDMNFPAILRISVAATLVHAIASVTLAAWGWGAVGMAWASTLSVAATVAGTALCYPRDTFLPPSLGEWRRVLGFGVFACGAQLLNTIGERAADLIVGRVLGFEMAGLYSRGAGLITLFQQAVMDAAGTVAISAFAQISRAGQDLRRPFLQFLGYTTAVAWPCLAMMAVLALPIIRLAFGAQWLPAVPAARILCLGAAFLVLARGAMLLFNATGTVRQMFRVQCMAVPLAVAALLAGARFGIEAAAWGAVAGSLAHTALALAQAARVAGTAWREIAAALAKSAVITLATLAAPLAILHLHGIPEDAPWLPAAAAAVTGGASWLACLFAIRHPLAAEILALLRRSAPVAP